MLFLREQDKQNGKGGGFIKLPSVGMLSFLIFCLRAALYATMQQGERKHKMNGASFSNI